MICGSERLHTLSVSLLEISRKDKPVGELCTHGIVPANDCNWPPSFLSEVTNTNTKQRQDGEEPVVPWVVSLKRWMLPKGPRMETNVFVR